MPQIWVKTDVNVHRIRRRRRVDCVVVVVLSDERGVGGSVGKFGLVAEEVQIG